MPAKRSALFRAGLIVHTDAAYDALEAAHGHERIAGTMPGSEYVNRHLSGDFGDVDEELRQANLSAIETGHPVYSSYRLPTGDDLWIIIEAERAIGHRPQTSLLLSTEASTPGQEETPS